MNQILLFNRPFQCNFPAGLNICVLVKIYTLWIIKTMIYSLLSDNNICSSKIKLRYRYYAQNQNSKVLNS